jgi:glycosyltransferase involved in cell wall biosynthesis
MTFNHEEFIAKAMESILMQQTDFHVQVVVGDDFSTDRTLEIIKSFSSTDKIHIHILKREVGDSYWKKRKQLGRLYNFINIIENCSGKYIALLDGDDYWTDPLKLQKQVDFLESNPDCVVCHHWQEIAEMDENGIYVKKPAPKTGHGYLSEKVSSVERIFSNELRVKTRTNMFKNVGIHFPPWFTKVAFGDIPLSMLLGKYGKFGFIDEPMAVYRVTGKGVSTRGKESPGFIFVHFLKLIKIWELGSKYYGSAYNQQATKSIIYFYKIILRHYRGSILMPLKLAWYCLVKSELSLLKRINIFYTLVRLGIKKEGFLFYPKELYSRIRRIGQD